MEKSAYTSLEICRQNAVIAVNQYCDSLLRDFLDGVGELQQDFSSLFETGRDDIRYIRASNISIGTEEHYDVIDAELLKSFKDMLKEVKEGADAMAVSKYRRFIFQGKDMINLRNVNYNLFKKVASRAERFENVMHASYSLKS